MGFANGERKSLTKIKAMFKAIDPQYTRKTIQQLEDKQWKLRYKLAGQQRVCRFRYKKHKWFSKDQSKFNTWLMSDDYNNRDLQDKKVFLKTYTQLKVRIW